MNRILGVRLTMVAMALAWSPAALADTIYVPWEWPTIQAAVDHSADGDTIVVGPGTYTGSGNTNVFLNGHDVTITSNGDPSITIIDCQGAAQAILANSGESFQLVGFTIRNGYNGAGGPDGGGAVYCNGGLPTIRNCRFETNISVGQGGAVRASGLVLIDSFFTGNQAAKGGALSCEGTATIVGCEFQYNDASVGSGLRQGGAIFASGNLEIGDCEFFANTSEQDGGAIRYAGPGLGTVANCLFRDNTVNLGLGRGGAVYSSSGNTLTLLNDSFSGGFAWRGADVFGLNCGLTLRNSILWSSVGPIEIDGATVTAEYCDIRMASGTYPGTNNLNADPLWVAGTLGLQYLSQIAAGQAANSPCLNAGSASASAVCYTGLGSGGVEEVCLNDRTTRTDDALDGGIADLGYHFVSSVITPTPTRSPTRTPTITPSPQPTATMCTGSTHQVAIYEEHFETWPPPGWEIVNNGGDCVWESTATAGRPNYAGGHGLAAVADSRQCGEQSLMDTELRSPVWDLSGYSKASLDVTLSFESLGDDRLAVDGSSNGGATWGGMLDWSEGVSYSGHGPGEVVRLDLTPYLGPQARVRFVYDAYYYQYWAEVDDVFVRICVSNTTPSPTPSPTFVAPTATPTIPQQVSLAVLVPFWQQGFGEQTFFSFYSAPAGSTGFELGLDLYDETGIWLQSAPPVHLDPGDLYPPDTGGGGWYASADRYGGAVASLSYDAPPVAGDLFSAWAAVYTMVGGAQPGFTVPVPQSPLAPASAGRSLRTGSGRVLIPAWETRGGAVTFYSLWNAPGSAHAADLSITWRDLAGTPVGSTSMNLAPGELACLETRPPLVPAGDHLGVGEIEIDFGAVSDPADQVVLWSTIYGVFGGAQVGFPVALELADEPLPPTREERATEYVIQSPFWQAGWDLNTIWSCYNSPDSVSTVDLWLDLYGLDGATLVDSSPVLSLSPGEGGIIDTAETWYSAGWQLGVASIRMEYAVAPDADDVVGLWSAVYSDPQPGDARTGFTVSVPGAPVRPFNLAPSSPLATAGGTRQGSGTVLIPFWQEGLGVHSFWSLWNSPYSNESATLTVRLRSVGGSVVELETSTLSPGQAWLIDTQESWYTAGEEYRAGEIEIAFPGGPDAANQVTLWEAVYGVYLGYQVGYPVELR